jgi:hypothetical protein
MMHTMIHYFILKDRMGPFIPKMMALVCSAMTHISESVRLDALKLCDLFVTVVPSVAATYSSKVIRGVRQWGRKTHFGARFCPVSWTCVAQPKRARVDVKEWKTWLS